jgi:hypothetical protein
MEEEITLSLSSQEREALRALAKFEMRTIDDQAHFIIRRDLERRGLLQSVEQVLPSISQEN